MIVYIAGPVAGRPLEERRKAFAVARSVLHISGFDHLDPTQYPPTCDGRCLADHPKERETDEHARKCYLKWDIVQMLTFCQGVALIPGWELSSGARMERDVALHCGLDVRLLKEWL
jgi:hypothetical protein